jgi:hypothetical protein
MSFNADRVRENVQQATTEDLLDRFTVYREGMEPEALEIIETELSRRRIGPEEIEKHSSQRQNLLLDANGLAHQCSLCDRPAVLQKWGWHRVTRQRRLGLSLFPFPRPRRFYYCEQHRSGKSEA